jgi:cyclopropane fatty-acyl-phospholipid synthase-like methyltransferase
VLLTVDLERLRVRRGEILLDAGCGEGRHCFGAIERGARVVGLDLDRASLHKAAGALRYRGASSAGSARCSRATRSTCRSATPRSTR